MSYTPIKQNKRNQLILKKINELLRTFPGKKQEIHLYPEQYKLLLDTVDPNIRILYQDSLPYHEATLYPYKRRNKNG